MLKEFETRIYRALLAARKSLEFQCRKRRGQRGSASAHKAFRDMLANPDCSEMNLEDTKIVREWIRFGVKSVFTEHRRKIQPLPVAEAELLVATLCKQFFLKQMVSYLDIDVFDADHPIHGNSLSLNQGVGDDGKSELGDFFWGGLPDRYIPDDDSPLFEGSAQDANN